MIKIKQYIEPFQAYWNKQSKKGKRIFLAILCALVVLSLVLMLLMNRTVYTVLYPSLDSDETMEVVQELQDRGVDFKEKNGTVMVPKSQEDSLRMDLSNAGHPRTSPNYDFFLNNVDIMTTDQEKKIIKEYQLELKLISVIKSMDCIKDADVIITVADDNGYIFSSSGQEGSKATVKLSLAAGKELQPTQVQGIKRLIASSVPRLSESDVVVVDNATGNELRSGEATQLDLANFKREVEGQFEQEIAKKVNEMLIPLFGEGNVRVTAKSTMDIDKKIQEIITYTPSEGNTGVIEQEDHQSEAATDEDGAIGVPGTDTNTEVPGYPGITVDGDKIYVKNQDSIKYLVSQMKEQIQRESGELKDLSVAVVVNRAELSAEQKIELSELVAASASVSVDKVVFYNDTFFEKIPIDQPIADVIDWNALLLPGGAALAGILIMGLILLLLRKGRRDKEELIEEDLYPGVQPIGGGAYRDMAPQVAEIHVQETKEQALRKEIQDFTSQNPEISAQLIRTWLKGDDANG